MGELRKVLRAFGFHTAASAADYDAPLTAFQAKAWSVYQRHGTFLDMSGRAWEAPRRLAARRTHGELVS